MAEEEREFLARIAVQREEQDVGALVEDRLGAVAVVIVDIQDRDPGGALVAQPLGGDRGVVEKQPTPIEWRPGA
jgi:hypothetical protein